MALPVPGAGRRGLLSFRLFGFPVSIHASFLVIVLFLGFGNGTAGGAIAWLLVVTVSVLAHELGHAFVAAPAGGEPRIDLYMMAGLTTWKPQRASRSRRVAVSVAGPFAGVVFGVALIVLHSTIAPVRDSFLDLVLIDAIVVNLGWGLLNLLPMLPLDGGQVVLALMPGNELARIKRTSVVSLVVAGTVALAAMAVGQGIPALLVVFFAFGNAQRLMALSKAKQFDVRADPIRRAEVAVLQGDPEEALRLARPVDGTPVAEAEYVARVRAMALLRLGRARDAQGELLDLPPGWVDPVFEATVLLANGQEQLAREKLPAALAGEPQPWAVRELVRILIERGDDVVSVIGPVTGYGAAGVLDAMYAAGEYAAAAAWGERALGTGAVDATVAYNTACAYARAGDPERALRSLGYAAELGWRDASLAESDPDLAAVRALPPWPDVRARMAANRD